MSDDSLLTTLEKSVRYEHVIKTQRELITQLRQDKALLESRLRLADTKLLRVRKSLEAPG